MAEVFLGAMIGAEGFSRRVAIKRVLPGYSDNPSFAQMFVAEAQISSRLVHPNIVSVVDFDRDADNRLFLVMELVEGKDLDTLVSSGLLPYPVVIFVISEVLRGLGHAHDLPVGNDVRGVIHRDVSPHNVLLSWEGSVKVSDFGIAKARSASSATASVFIKGKPAYMSPEQANGQALDGRSDLFAVGIMLWEMLIGRRLFEGEDTRSTLAAVLFGQVPRPRSLRSDVPKDLERVTMKLLERDLSQRYATAEAAVQDLLECGGAPKNGREALTRILAERFPDVAPVRQSLHRLRSSDHGPPVSGPDNLTIPNGSAGRPPTPPLAVAASPSLSSVMQARTGTIEHPATRGRGLRKTTKILLVGAITIATGSLAFGIVAAITSSRKPKEGGGGGSGSAATMTIALPDARDAPSSGDARDARPPEMPGPSDAPLPPAPIDARVPDAAAAGSGGGHTAAVTTQRYGRLVVRAYPILTVYFDAKKLGDTPINIREPTGKHVVRLVNVDNGHDEKVSVQITDGQTTTVERIP